MSAEEIKRPKTQKEYYLKQKYIELLRSRSKEGLIAIIDNQKRRLEEHN